MLLKIKGIIKKISFFDIILIILSILIVHLLCYRLITEKKELIAKYDKGIEYYEMGEYEKASECFGNLINLSIGERNGEAMYTAILQQLNKERTYYVCPHCGYIVNTENLK